MKTTFDNRIFPRLVCLLSCLMLALVSLAPVSSASGVGQIVFDDAAGLIDGVDARTLRGTLSEISAYIDVGFVTTDDHAYPSSKAFAKDYVYSHFGTDAAVIFLIDMVNREICVYANDAGLEAVSEADSRAITDNVYRYASRGDYYGCANEAFAQIMRRVRGLSIPRPIKHITNFLIAGIFAMLLNFLFVFSSRSAIMNKRASSEAMKSMAKMPEIRLLGKKMTSSHRVHHSSGGGGHGGGRSFGGGGGGFGGGGGGGGSHRF